MTPAFLQTYGEATGFSTIEEAEADIVAAIYEVGKSIGRKFRFGYLDNEDMAQESAVFALEAINDGDYDPTRPIRPFLRSHIHNRLYNFKRDNFFRMEIPCRCCEIDTSTPCLKYAKWLKRNQLKKGLALLGSLEYDPVACNPSPNSSGEAAIDLQHLKDTIPVELRSTLLRALEGLAVSPTKKAKLAEYLGDEYV